MTIHPPATKFLGLRAGIAVLLLLTTVFFGTVVRAQETEAPPKGVTVTLLLFSGRPNPTYHIRDRQLLERLTGLVAAAPANPAFGKATVVPSVLGYNGILVENDGEIPGIPPTLVVYRDDLEARNAETRFLKDDGRGIERFLLDQALKKNVIDAATLDFIGAMK